MEIARPVLERYQRHLFYARKKNGEPLTFRTQHGYLVPLRVWFKWMTRQNHILHNPASEIDLPRLSRTLPKNIPTPQEIEKVMMQPDIREPVGLRDRAILELLLGSQRLRMLLTYHPRPPMNIFCKRSSRSTPLWRRRRDSREPLFLK